MVGNKVFIAEALQHADFVTASRSPKCAGGVRGPGQGVRIGIHHRRIPLQGDVLEILGGDVQVFRRQTVGRVVVEDARQVDGVLDGTGG